MDHIWSSMKLRVAFIIILVIILMRLALPYVLLNYAERRINQIPEYHVTIKDLDVHLYRGSYTIKDIDLKKVNKNIPVPFFSAEAIELSVEWQALLHGLFVAQITAYRPALNFVSDPRGQNEQLTIDREWQNAVKALFPLNFNRITVHNGSLHFISFNGRPPFDLYLKNIEAKLKNFHDKKANEQHKLSSILSLTAQGMDGSPVTLQLKFDPFAKQPTFDLDAEIKNMKMKEANNFLLHYTKIKVAQGRFSLYAEAAAANGKITGYAKPLIKNLKVIEPKEDTSVIESIYKGAVQFVANVLKNPDTKAVATKIEFKGNIDDPDASLWSIVSNLLSNAFLQAVLPRIDNSINMQNAA